MSHSIRFFISLLRIDFFNFLRNKTAAFWTFGFPLLLLAIFMATFGQGSGLGSVSLRFVDQDRTEISEKYITYVRSTMAEQHTIAITEASGDNNADTLTITVPQGFQEDLLAHHGVSISTSTTSGKSTAQIIASQIISSVSDDFVLRKLYNYNGIQLAESANTLIHGDDSAENYSLYLVTGLLCMNVISTALMGFAIPLIGSRQFGYFRPFELMPISHFSVTLALAISKFFIILATAIVLFGVGAAIYHVPIPSELSVYFNALLVLTIGLVGFLSLALLIVRLVNSQEWANIVCNLIYFPLIMTGNLFIPMESVGDLANLVRNLPVNQFSSTLRGVILHKDTLSMHWLFFAEFGCIIVTSLLFSGRALISAGRTPTHR